jgi:hypothetical protein
VLLLQFAAKPKALVAPTPQIVLWATVVKIDNARDKLVLVKATLIVRMVTLAINPPLQKLLIVLEQTAPKLLLIAKKKPSVVKVTLTAKKAISAQRKLAVVAATLLILQFQLIKFVKKSKV